jgi:predicted nucleic acid-binding protein
VVKVLTEWKLVQQQRLAMVPVYDAAFGLAAYYIDLREFVLRSGDALHLAVASLGGHSLATLDRQLRQAAVAVGLKAEEV